ncbi:hypothetical protein Nepgr_013585 [Nepenthes gracilis]|uniref:Uncharacterized protein n=1 Tax=Nepenthes gracilis TaxID=150966 RepID=A0AAD3XPA7_NEPGR|nr:hypothetical protein Nepgr_013585 [Nepenthes gracilis]
MKTAAMGQNAHGVIQTGPMLQVSSSKLLQSSVKKPKGPIPHSPVFGTRPMLQASEAISVDDSKLPVSADRGARADCNFPLQDAADQVDAPPRSDHVRSLKQAPSLKSLKSILKKPKCRRLASPSLADLVATDC